MSEHFERLQEVFNRARLLAPDERGKYLDEACAGDDELRRDVESLLTHGNAEDFMDATLQAHPTPAHANQVPTVATPTGPPPASTGPKSSSSDTPLLAGRLCPTCKRKYDHTRILCPHDSELLVEDPEWIVGSTLDRTYYVERLLDKGGMGAVYLARHEFLNRRFAIKTLVERFQGNVDVRERFIREARALFALSDHPNVVKVTDLRVVESGLIYMVLEYLDGQTLRNLARERGPVSANELVEILVPVASVLDAAHARGIVHRDLKPENIMVTWKSGEPVVKVFDLGVAKLLDMAKSLMGGVDGRGTLTTMGEIMGTPVYMSPEQWGIVPRDGNHEVDGRTDVYSLGVMVYELVSGERPFSGGTLSDLRREHRKKIPTPLDEVVPDVPKAFGSAVARAMAKDRDDRYPTAGEFVRDLQASLGEHERGPRTGDETVVRDTDAASRPRVPALKLAIGASAAVLAVVTAALYWPTTPVPPPTSPVTSLAPTASRTEVLRFGIELEPLDGSGKTVSATSRDPIAPDRRFYFRFVPKRDGYVYILCPLGERNVLGTILTAHGGENAARAGEEFVFPRRDGIFLSSESLTTTFTVVFSPEPLTSPAFLAGPALHELSAREQKELADLRTRYGGQGLEIALVEAGAAEAVTIPGSASDSQPIVFDVPMRIVPDDTPTTK